MPYRLALGPVALMIIGASVFAFGLAWQLCRLGIRGRKSLGIDTVIDLSYPRGGHADLGDEKASKILRYRGVTMNQRAVEPAQNARPEPAAIQIAYVPTMLAVDPDRNATGPCRNEGIES